MKSWKQVTLVLALVLLVPSCGISADTRTNRIQQLVGSNESLYKGGYGIICGDMYLKKGDASNNLYSASRPIFQGNARTAQQLVYVKNPTAPAPVTVDLEGFQLPKDGIVILFARDFVYVLNLSANNSFKYRR